jgi:hypothetical protein
MARAHFYRPILDQMGNIQPNTSVRLLAAGSSSGVPTDLSAVVTSDPNGTAAVAHTFVSLNGILDLWTDTPMYAAVGLTPPGGAEIIIDYVAFQAPGASVSGSGPSSVQIGDLATSSGTNSIAIGTSTQATFDDTISIGAGAVATAAYQATLGGVESVEMVPARVTAGTTFSHATSVILHDGAGGRWAITVDATGSLFTTAI